jgi:hypothetical protein
VPGRIGGHKCQDSIEALCKNYIQMYSGSSQCKVSSVTLMRRFSSNSRKNQIYKAFRECGRVMRTVALLRFLADSGLRARVTAATNRAEAYNGFSAWAPVRQPGRDRRERPGRAGTSVKWNSLGRAENPPSLRQHAYPTQMSAAGRSSGIGAGSMLAAARLDHPGARCRRG